MRIDRIFDRKIRPCRRSPGLALVFWLTFNVVGAFLADLLGGASAG